LCELFLNKTNGIFTSHNQPKTTRFIFSLSAILSSRCLSDEHAAMKK